MASPLAEKRSAAFIHQDVFLHSLKALKEAAGQLSAGGFGLLGAVGIGSEGRIVGHIEIGLCFWDAPSRILLTWTVSMRCCSLLPDRSYFASH